MSTQSSYYKLIREKIEKKINSKIDENTKNCSSLPSSDINNETLSTEISSTQNFTSSFKSSWDLVHQWKQWQQFNVKIFLSKFQNLNNRTNKGYLKMIYDFIIFSLDIDQEDLEIFMEHKFKITPLNSQFKTPYKGTKAKYAITLKRFLKSIYTIDDIDVKASHYRKKKKWERNVP